MGFRLSTKVGDLFESAIEDDTDLVIANVRFSTDECAAIFETAGIDTYDGRVTHNVMSKEIRNLRMSDVEYLKILCNGKEARTETFEKMIVYV